MDLLQFVFDKLYSVSGFERFSIEQAICFVLIVVAVFLAELTFVGWNRSSVKKVLSFNRSVRTDLIMWMVETFNLSNILSFIFSLGICYYLVGLVQKNVHFELAMGIENVYLQFALIFILADFKGYVKHWVFHRFGPLWKVHAFHHSATSLNVITRYRGHFIELALGRFFDVIPLVLLGAPIHTYLSVRILVEIHQLVVHSNIDSDWGTIGKYVLVSPAAHRLHHSVKEEHFNKNYGLIFICWDRLFNTYCPPERIEQFGLPGNEFNRKGFAWDVWLVMTQFFQEIRKLLFRFRSN